MKSAVPLALCLLAALAPSAVSAAGELRSLRDCIDIALERHPILKSADAVVAAAGQRVWQAGSSYLPQLSANYSADRRHTSATARIGVGTTTPAQTFWFYNSGVAMSQVLFDFGQTLNSIRSAQASERALQADAVTQRAIVSLNVKQAYFQVLAARRLKVVTDDTVMQNEKHLELAEGRLRVGLAPKFDVTQAQVQLANAELDRITARNNVDLALETLRSTMGLVDPIDFDIVDSLGIRTVSIDDQAILQVAYISRPEMQAVVERQQALAQQISALKKAQLPRIVGNGSYQWTGSDYPLQSNWELGAAVSFSIFNGGLTLAQVGEAEANLASLQFEEAAQRNTITLEVRQATLDLHRAEEAIAVAEKGLQQARENAALAGGRYRTGIGSFIEVTDAQASRSSAEASHVQTLYSYKTAVAALERATSKDLSSE